MGGFLKAHSILLALCVAASIGRAFAESPSINYAVPAAAIPGTTTRIVFHGTNLKNATALWTSFPCTATPVRDEGANDSSRAAFDLTLPAAVPAGIGALRLATTSGLSSLQLFLIDDLPTTAGSGSNRSRATAQRIAPPVSVEGACTEQALDFYSFEARKGDRIAVEVVASRLGSRLDPVIQLLDASGRELAYCDDAPGAGADCRLAHRFSADGKYYLAIHDVNYAGGAEYRYRLRVGDFPIPSIAFPMGARRGQNTSFTFAGGDVRELPAVSVLVLNDQRALFLAPRLQDGQRSGLIGVVTSGMDELIEAEPNDSPVSATKVVWPTAINGRFDHSNDRDYFRFPARRGDKLEVQAQTRRLGSACDVALKIVRPDGSGVAASKVSSADDGTIAHTFAEEGEYLLLVQELNERFGPELVYRIQLVPQPPFELSVDVDKLEADAGGRVEIKVNCARRDYKGPVELYVKGLPEGAELDGHVIAEGKKETILKVKLPPTHLPSTPSTISIVGKASGGDGNAIVPVGTGPALKKLFPQLLYPPIELDGLIGLGLKSPNSKE